MDSRVQKISLRRHLKDQRAKLSTQEKSLTSQVITQKLLELIDWPKINSLHSYATIESLNEVDTLPLLEAIKQRWPQINITLADKNTAPPDQPFDVIIVPVLGFDSQGHRLGLGGGYYDRFLATQQQALTVGLCYDFGLIDTLPHEPHDIPLRYIVTEKKVYKYNDKHAA